MLYKTSEWPLFPSKFRPPQSIYREGLDLALPLHIQQIMGITNKYYNDAREYASRDKVGKAFTDHTQEHVNMVMMKSSEAASAIEAYNEKKPLYENLKGDGRVDLKTLQAAALSHDTGMAGMGYALKKDPETKKYVKKADSYEIDEENMSDFNQIRENHSLNSAINVLIDRVKYRAAGFDDDKIDKIAAECMAHSKSSSGVTDLSSIEQWEDCFNRINSAVIKYNEKHPEKITFNEGKKLQNNLRSLALETLALRIGDVSRDSSDDAEAHSGMKVHVERDTLKMGTSVDDELAEAKITLLDPVTKESIPIQNQKSRQVHAGEQNIIKNQTFFDKSSTDTGRITHKIYVADLCSAPHCTQEAIKDHLGELQSAGNNVLFKVVVSFENYDAKIDTWKKFIEKITEEYKEIEKISDSISFYDQFRMNHRSDYENVEICFPWDVEDEN